MRNRLLAALIGLTVAGCTSQQPQNLSYSPAPALQPPTVGTAAGAPALQPGQSQATAPTASLAEPAVTTSAAGFPPAPACGAGSAATACPPSVERTCRTTGNVTTCDVPADPGSDSTLYTN